MSNLFINLKGFLKDRFNLNDDKADEQSIVDSIRKDVAFKGVNVWTLIFAIFIASIGLNVNSTAVIIGAMLISPLMGPIMGIGLAMAINDFDLVKKSLKNLLIAAAISITTSFLYFLITPLHDASSELLARTSPSVWDVFIAFIGGLAGIVAGTRKEKSNVIPGVAIATALMPPLCTAGFGLATGMLTFFLGAIYLFFINSLFICLATFLIVKHLRFKKVEFSTPEQEKRVSRYIFIIAAVTIIPSVYFAYRIVQRSIFESNAKTFLSEEFHFQKTQVVTKDLLFDGGKQKIEVLLIGELLSDATLDTLKRRLPKYSLGNTQLVVHQGLDAKQKIDLSEIKASVLEAVYAKETILDTPSSETAQGRQANASDVREELKALYPGLVRYTVSDNVFINTDSTDADTITLFVATFKPVISGSERKKLGRWIKERLQRDSVRVVLE